jgi:hypothetical protein
MSTAAFSAHKILFAFAHQPTVCVRYHADCCGFPRYIELRLGVVVGAIIRANNGNEMHKGGDGLSLPL